MRITAKDKDGKVIEIMPYQMYSLMHNTQSEEYVRAKPKTEYEESQIKKDEPTQTNNGWKYVSVDARGRSRVKRKLCGGALTALIMERNTAATRPR